MACTITSVDVSWNAQNVRNVKGNYTVDYYDTDTRQTYSFSGMLMNPRQLSTIEDLVRNNQAGRLGGKYYGTIGMDPNARLVFNLVNDDDTYPVETLYDDTYERFRLCNIGNMQFSVRGDFYENELYTGEDYTRASMDALQSVQFTQPEVQAAKMSFRQAGRRGNASSHRTIDFLAESQAYADKRIAEQRAALDKRDAEHAARNTRKDPVMQRELPAVVEKKEEDYWMVRPVTDLRSGVDHANTSIRPVTFEDVARAAFADESLWDDEDDGDDDDFGDFGG